MMEILISCVIIGVLAVILIPTLQSAKPDKNEALHKKSTFIVERVINELSGDNNLYPNNGEYSSLSNTDNVTYNNETHGGATKFCTLFGSRIKLKPGTEISCREGEKSFTSEDGIDWYLPVSDFKNGAETIMVDVNGGAGPNEIGEDQFEYKVQPGFKIPKKEIPADVATSVTPDAPAAPTGTGTVQKPDVEEKPSQAVYSIDCQASGAVIYGTGGNKVNGNYTLVAVPEPGFKCNWFTKQVTVKDANVGDCDLTCEADTLRPIQPGGNVIPTPGGDDDDDDDDDDDEPEEPTYCASVSWGGSSEYCSDSGQVCGKSGDSYSISIESTDTNYKAIWTQGQGSGTFGDSNVVLKASCDAANKCYDLNITGDANCPFVLPAANCPYPDQETKYTAGTYNVTVTPKEGYTFNGKEGTVSYPVTVNGTNSKVDLSSLCKKGYGDTGILRFILSLDTGIQRAGYTTINIFGPNGTKYSTSLVGENGDSVDVEVPAGTYTYEGSGVVYLPVDASWCPNFATKGFQPGTTNVMAGGTSGVNALFTCQDRPSQTCTISVQRSCGINGVGYMYQVSANCAGQARLRLSYVDMDGKTHTSKEAAFFDNVKQQTSCLVVTNWGTHTCSDGTIGPSVNAAGEQWYITMNGFSQTCDTEKKEMCKVTMETATGGTTTPEGGTTTTVECGKALNISATPSSGYIFREWSKTSGDGTFRDSANKSTTFTPKSDSTIKANFDKQGGDPTCTINLIGDGGFGGQVNAKVNLSGGASKSVTLSSSNSYKATWSGMACGEKYTVSATAELSSSANKEAWADAVLSATAEPDSFTLNEEQDVYIKITDSAVQDCGIEVQGTGDTGNGVFANISLSGGASETATLDESNNYLATWTGLTCGKSYTVSVSKAGEKKNGAVTTTKVTATVNPSGAFTITGQANDVTKYVTVDLKKEEAKKYSLTVSFWQENHAGVAIADPEPAREIEEGATYTVKAKTVNGCTVIGESTRTGIMPNYNKNEIFWYKCESGGPLGKIMINPGYNFSGTCPWQSQHTRMSSLYLSGVAVNTSTNEQYPFSLSCSGYRCSTGSTTIEVPLGTYAVSSSITVRGSGGSDTCGLFIDSNTPSNNKTINVSRAGEPFEYHPSFVICADMCY